MREIEERGARGAADPRQRGSALLMAIFVLFIVTNLGIALLFLSRNEQQLSLADGRSKRVFYIAEAGLEDARRTLFLTNGEGPFNDDLDDAAGIDDAISFDVTQLLANFDAAGNLTGFDGVGDDVPVSPLTAFGDGSYVAYLTNDPVEGRSNKADLNNRVMITGIGVGSDRAVEVVQAIVQPRRPFPVQPSAAITLLGPTPSFSSGSGNPGEFRGDDCGVTGGIIAPTVATTDAAAAQSVESGIDLNNGPDFTSGAYTELDTVVDMTDTADPMMVDSGISSMPPEYQDCMAMRESVFELQARAQHTTLQAAYGPSDVTFIDGDCDLGPGDSGQGILVVTGVLTIDGNTDWNGLIIAIGQGSIERNGGGSGTLSGAIVVADVAGPDNIFGNADDCQSGFEVPTFHVNGNGNSDVQFCTTDLSAANPIETYKIEEFIQR
jgi:hypothetical protein